MGEYGSGQSRARGITRAILDTFPVIKFTGSPATNERSPKPTDTESGASFEQGMEMGQVAHDQRPSDAGILGEPGLDHDGNDGGPASAAVPHGSVTASGAAAPAIVAGAKFALNGVAAEGDDADHVSDRRAGPSRLSASSAAAEGGLATRSNPDDATTTEANVVPASIGRDTCPICIVDFEEGDDLRVLPCEGKHVFHQTCVDPWLLELSSSCPICRHDFHALEEMISGGAADQSDPDLTNQEHRASTHGAGSRFSRYLRFARGRRGRQWGNRDSIVEDPTDPPYPLAPDQ